MKRDHRRTEYTDYHISETELKKAVELWLTKQEPPVIVDCLERSMKVGSEGGARFTVVWEDSPIEGNGE